MLILSHWEIVYFHDKVKYANSIILEMLTKVSSLLDLIYCYKNVPNEIVMKCCWKFWILFQISHLLSRVEQSIMQQEAKLKIAYKESNQQLQVLDTK